MSKDNINENVPIAGGLTPSEIEKLKRQHKTSSLSLVTVETEDGKTLHYWFKKIDMDVFSAASKFIESNPVKATKIIFDSTLIKGDKDAANEVSVFSAISPKLLETIGTATASLKKF